MSNIINITVYFHLLSLYISRILFCAFLFYYVSMCVRLHWFSMYCSLISYICSFVWLSTCQQCFCTGNSSSSPILHTHDCSSQVQTCMFLFFFCEPNLYVSYSFFKYYFKFLYLTKVFVNLNN